MSPRVRGSHGDERRPVGLTHLGVIVDPHPPVLLPRIRSWRSTPRAVLDVMRDVISWSHDVDIQVLSIWPISTSPDALCEIRRDLESACAEFGFGCEVIDAERTRRIGGRAGRCVYVFAGYDGRREVANALHDVARQTNAYRFEEADIERAVLTGPLPEPDLIIRTSRCRSHEGFLLWQSVRSELWFHQRRSRLTRGDFRAALASYASRQRRFGA